MMGKIEDQEQFCCEVRLNEHVPADHLLRRIDAGLDLFFVRPLLAPSYSSRGRPSVDPELMLRMLLIGYPYGIRSRRRFCDDIRFNLAYRWFCRLGLNGAVPDHSTFSKNRHGRFRICGLFRALFEQVVERCTAAGLVAGQDMAVDASVVTADASPARFAAEMATTKVMLRRTRERFGVAPERLAADKAYGSTPLLAWLFQEGVEPHIPVLERKHQTDGKLTRDSFAYDPAQNVFVCPQGKVLRLNAREPSKRSDHARSPHRHRPLPERAPQLLRQLRARPQHTA